MPHRQGFSQQAYREQHFDCLACHVAASIRAGIGYFSSTATRGSTTTSPGGAG